ncbi:MAG TPA: BON domain-containing protein [Gemmataceae bacterium]|nr:BON domain-containing protein [Gemmataceae bacterium]
MISRLPIRAAAATGLWLAQLGAAAEPARLPLDPIAPQAVVSLDQQLADHVAQRLAELQLRGYEVDIASQNGVVELIGSVSAASQRDEILRVAKATPGVTQVREQIQVRDGVLPVNGLAPPAPLGEPTPLGGGILPGGPGGPIDPMPINGGGPAHVLAPPAMPPYAWPTYAPYNNYSRVAYPDLYPYSSFPFIGPMYPFPKVPLGYRAIKLEWENGHWWYGRTKTQRDFWQARYW